MIQVLVTDDHPVIREGVVSILAAEPGIRVIGELGSAEDALRRLSEAKADVIVLDVRLPGMSGIDLCTVLRERHPRVRPVILTAFPGDGVLMEALAAGARGFVLKESGPAVLREAVRAVANGDIYVDPRVTGKLVALATRGRQAKGPFGLTVQEMRVVELLPRGLTNRVIGEQLGISEATVKTHLHNAMRKLQATNRAQVVALAQREGLA
jgi:DNA-binding NarL/FixJ family response regulator